MKIAFFGHDAYEPTLRKRIEAFQREGADVIGFTAHRPRDGMDPPDPTWRNVDLGPTMDRAYGRRMLALATAIRRILPYLQEIADADVIYARNLDMAAVAAIARTLARGNAPFAYEVLDVQRIMTADGRAGAAFRALERRVLASADLLVVSSPEFISKYFAPVQGYGGPWALLENKVPPQAARRAAPMHPANEPPWTIGWSGVLRCRRSLATLTDIAQRAGDRVRVVLRGRLSPADITEDDVEAAHRAARNLAFAGPYTAPDDLPEVYGGVHLTWAVDYTDAGANSDWLIPNRIYEGGLFGAVPLARAGTATGALVERLGIGWTFEEPMADSVTRFLEQLTPEMLAERRSVVEAVPRSQFVDEDDTRRLLRRLASHRQRASLLASVSRTM